MKRANAYNAELLSFMCVSNIDYCATGPVAGAANLITDETLSETNSGDDSSTSSASTDTVSRRGERRMIINTKKQLKEFLADNLNAYLESLANNW